MADKQADTKKQGAEPQVNVTRHPAETVPVDALMSLQGSIGNAAVGRMLGARNKAADEKPTPVSPHTQSAIDAQSNSGGEALEGGLQEQMEAATGGRLDGVRIHRDPESDALARKLDANAFTQGRNVYLRGDRDLVSEVGQATLVHELTHVARGAPQAGAVMREPYQMTRGDVGLELAMSMETPTDYAHQTNVIYNKSTGGTIIEPTIKVDKEPTKPSPIVPATWDIDINIDDKFESKKGLKKDEAFDYLRVQLKVCDFLKGYYRDQHREVLDHREDHPVVGFICDLLGDVDPPPIGIWDEVDPTLEEARKAVGFSARLAADMTDPAEVKRKEAENKAEEEKYISRGSSIVDLDKFTHNPMETIPAETEKMRYEDDAAADLIEKAAYALSRASRQMIVKDKVVFYYKEGSTRGAERAVKVLEVVKSAGKVAAVVATGGVAAEAELGIVATSAAMGLGGGTYEATQEFAQQGGEMIFGDRDHFDWGKVAKVGVKAAVVNFVGGLTGGAFGKVLGNSLGRMVGGVPADLMATYGITGQQLLTNGERLFVMWVGNTATSPFGTAAGAVMDRAVFGKWTVTSMDEFFDLALHDMVMSGAIGGFFSFAHAHTTPTEVPTGGTGTGEPTSGGGGGGSGDGGGGGGGRPTIRGMGAAGPAGENAPPIPATEQMPAARVTEQGMGAAGPAGEGATPAAPVEQPAARTTQQGMGEAGPAQEPAAGETQQGMGQAGPGPVQVPIEVINDIAAAQQAQAAAEANGDPYRWPRDPALVQDLWVREAGQDPNSTPPAAWTGPDGLVINGAIVPVETVAPVVVEPAGTQTGMGAAGPAGEGAGPSTTNGGGGSGGGSGGEPPAGGGAGPGTTQQGMGAAGPAGENAPPRPGEAVPEPVAEEGSNATTQPNEAPPVEEGQTGAAPGEPVRRYSETSDLTAPLDRSPEARMSVSGFKGSLPEGYGVYRGRVRLASGEVVEAAIKIYPSDMAATFARDMAGARAASRTGQAPEFYGQVDVPPHPTEARPGTTDLAFAMEPVEGAFPSEGTEVGDPGHSQAVRESEAAAARISDRTLADVRRFSTAILNEGYYYGGSHAGEVQGLIGPNGEWTPIDFQGLNELPPATDAAGRAEAIREHESWVQLELDNLEKFRTGAFDPDPTNPGTRPPGEGGGGGGGGSGTGGAGGAPPGGAPPVGGEPSGGAPPTDSTAGAVPGDDGTVSDVRAPGETEPEVIRDTDQQGAVEPDIAQAPTRNNGNGNGPQEGGQQEPSQQQATEPQGTEPQQQRSIHDEPTVIRYQEGLIHRGLSMPEAYESYYESIRDNSNLEAGIWEDVLSGEVVAIQGGPDFVSGEPLFHSEEFQAGRWRFVEHYQPGTEFFVRFPSGRDFRVMMRPQMNYGAVPEPVSSRILWRDPLVGDWVYTEYGYDPTVPEPFWIQYRNAQGVYAPERFSDVPWNRMSDYDRFLMQFGARSVPATRAR